MSYEFKDAQQLMGISLQLLTPKAQAERTFTES